METKLKELRSNLDFTLPCPNCGAECLPDEVTKLKRRKETADGGVTVVLPQHYLDLRCTNCNLQAWVALDEEGKPLDFP